MLMVLQTGTRSIFTKEWDYLSKVATTISLQDKDTTRDTPQTAQFQVVLNHLITSF